MKYVQNAHTHKLLDEILDTINKEIRIAMKYINKLKVKGISFKNEI